MNRIYIQVIAALFVFQTLIGNTSRADEATQIIQSAPEGTDLAIPGIADAVETWVRLINNSKTTIDIEQMYVDGKAGSVLDSVIAALEKAGERKVKIRLVLAKAMIDNNPTTLSQLRKIQGLELGVVDYQPITGGIQHSKFWIFDEKTAFVGSQNFDWKSLSQILETGVVFSDSTAVNQLQAVFDTDWQIAATGRAPNVPIIASSSISNAPLKLVASPPALLPTNVRSAFDALVELLKTAKKTVRITLLDISNTAYGETAPWLDLDKVLRETAARGVQIEFLVSHWNTDRSEVDTIKKLSLVPNIKVKIATIPDLASGHVPFSRVNHSKMMIVDEDYLWVGTSNWSKSYFFATRGIEVIMKDRALTKQGLAIFTKLWNQKYSEFVDPTRNYPKPIK